MSSDSGVARCALALLGLALTPSAGASQQVEGRVLLANQPVPGAAVYLVSEDPVVPSIEPVVVDQRHLRFVPGTVVVPPGTRVEFLNSDPVLHNVFSPGRGDGGFDLGWYPQGESRPFVFDRPGWYSILCHVHPEMLANVVVVPANHGAATGVDGWFRIDDVPPGHYEVRVWHPPLEDVAVRSIDVDAGSVTLEVRLSRNATPGGGATEAVRDTP